jgi:uncharacterized membrane protein YheB (UPF0754 family)
MKVEFELNDARVNGAINRILEDQAVLYYNEPKGPLAKAVVELVNENVGQIVSKIDLTDMIQARITTQLMPTLEAIIEQQIKTAAKKAVKAAMDQRQETQP